MNVTDFLTRRPQTKRELAMAARLHRRATTIHDTATALAATAEKLAKREQRTLWGGRP